MNRLSQPARKLRSIQKIFWCDDNSLAEELCSRAQVFINSDLVVSPFFRESPRPKCHKGKKAEVGDKEDGEKPGHCGLRPPVTGDHHESDDAKRDIDYQREADPEGTWIHQRTPLTALAVVDELEVDIEICRLEQRNRGLQIIAAL